ncbi:MULTISPECIES: Gfo/Idh/MocA family oxidoreductase [unclassified Nonomuraea]|uniref:Gfo/Idh/MocA family protein n=1 Tax=unclassified Nonomuraea TaxID=2593643 RepID=UPI0033E64BB7
MRIALAGLATSHPYTDARTLARHAELAVWEPDAERLRRFTEEHPEAMVAGALDELLAANPDGVVLTLPNPQVPAALERVLETGVPCFVNKPAAATREQLDALRRLPVHDRVMSGSVLRFAPAFAGVRADAQDVLSVRATVRHDVGQWADGYNAWQDTPGEGGGTMVTMGIHGVEPLVALLGPDVRLVGAAGARRHYRTLRSEDAAVLALQWANGTVGTVEILGVSDDNAYTVTLHSRHGSESAVIESGPDPVHNLGYVRTMEAFLSMVRGGPNPVPWAETIAILDILISAREHTPTT